MQVQILLHGKNEVLSWLHGKDGCWHGFNANEVLLWLHDKDERWHSFGANELLTWFRGKNNYWYDFNTSASANVECCHSFMVKMNVGMDSV